VRETTGRRLVPRWLHAYSELDELARRHGWRVVAPGPSDAWAEGWEPEAGTLVAWYEDSDTDVDYAVVEGPARASVEELIRAGMELLTPENSAEAVGSQQAPLLRGRTLMAVAVAAPSTPDEAVSSVIAQALRDADPFVRRYGLYAVEVLGWPALRAAAERLRLDDPDPQVRATASEVLGSG
jgi:hypothetical protein